MEKPIDISTVGLPPSLRGGILRYLNDGIRPGSFLTAIIEGDFEGARRKADPTNQALLPDLLAWFKAVMPGESWGSKEKMDAWVAKHEARLAQ